MRTGKCDSLSFQSNGSETYATFVTLIAGKSSGYIHTRKRSKKEKKSERD